MRHTEGYTSYICFPLSLFRCFQNVIFLFSECYFLFVCSSRLWLLFRRPLAGAQPERHNPEPEHCASPEARRAEPSSHPGLYSGQPTPGTRLARRRRARAGQRPLIPVGRSHRRADTAPHLEAGARLGSLPQVLQSPSKLTHHPPAGELHDHKGQKLAGSPAKV